MFGEGRDESGRLYVAPLTEDDDRLLNPDASEDYPPPDV